MCRKRANSGRNWQSSWTSARVGVGSAFLFNDDDIDDDLFCVQTFVDIVFRCFLVIRTSLRAAELDQRHYTTLVANTVLQHRSFLRPRFTLFPLSPYHHDAQVSPPLVCVGGPRPRCQCVGLAKPHDLPGKLSVSQNVGPTLIFFACQLVTDRFATTDGSSPTCNTEDRKYCGGTWQGVVKKLDYIQGMGFDAVWISPVVKNVEGTTAYGEAFHGYWTSDITQLNSHFGSADDLKALSKALHDRGMYLMVDVVVNHMAATQDPPDFGSFTPFNTQSDFHKECLIQAGDYFNNQTAVEQCWLGDSKMPLADINTEDTNIVNTWNTWIGDLVKNYSVDGVRIDTVKHVRKDFWPDFTKSAGVFTIGEVLDNRTTYVTDYTRKPLDYLSSKLLTVVQRSLTPSSIIPTGTLLPTASRLLVATCLLSLRLSRLLRARTRTARSTRVLSSRTTINLVLRHRLATKRYVNEHACAVYTIEHRRSLS